MRSYWYSSGLLDSPSMRLSLRRVSVSSLIRQAASPTCCDRMRHVSGHCGAGGCAATNAATQSAGKRNCTAASSGSSPFRSSMPSRAISG
eukprot:6632137-Prymnesium_polylepis.2